MQPSPLVVLSSATVLGVLAVSPLSDEGRLLTALGIALLAWYGFSRRCEPSPLRAALAIALALAAGNTWIQAQMRPTIFETRTERFDAVVLDRSENAGDGTIYTLTLRNGLTVTCLLAQHAEIGDAVVVRGRLEPFDDARNPGDPSERAIERERGIDAHIDSAQLLSRAPSPTFDLRVAIARLHQAALAQLRERLGEPGASIVAGELWGERSSLPPDLRTDFQESGTVHVLVTAGLHVGLIAALATWLFELLPIPRALSCVLVMLFACAFVVWSGAQLPALRAATMACVALTARACGRASFSWNALALAAIVIALLRPESVATASFALSFGCVGSILALATPIEEWLRGVVDAPHRIREALTLTLATQLGTWPIGAAIFLQFGPYALLANLAVVPLVPVTMLLGIAQLVTMPCDSLSQAFANLNGWAIAWIVGVVRTVGALPMHSIIMTPAPLWAIAFYLSTLLAAPILTRRYGLTLAITGLLFAVSLVLWPTRADDTRLRITMLDVGQADGIVVQTPGGHTILVDSGGRLERGPQTDQSQAEEIGERIVVPFLLRHGIHRVDALILSHPHGDHVGGAAPVMRALRVDEVADSGQRYSGHAYQDALAVARAQGIPIVYPRAGAVWRTDDGLVLRFIGPSLPFLANTGNDINDNSIAFILEYRHFRMLFTGDAGTAAEQRFLAEGIDLHATVLKDGHHGSAYGTSPEFLAAVAPRYAIISVGRHNMFGHPAPSTIDRLRSFGATIYRTDQNGAVMITTDGSSTNVSSVLRVALSR